MLLFHQPTQSLSRTLTHELTRAGARMSHDDPQFGNPSRLPVHRVCSPSAHRNFGMLENASLYEVAVFLYAAGLPWTETLWLRRRLESRTISRQLFTLLRRQLHMPGRSCRATLTDDFRQWFLEDLHDVEARRRSWLQRVANVGVEIRHLPCFTFHPSLVQCVLRFLAPPGLGVQRLTVCQCLGGGHGPWHTIGIESFLEHLEECHLQPSVSS